MKRRDFLKVAGGGRPVRAREGAPRPFALPGRGPHLDAEVAEQTRGRAAEHLKQVESKVANIRQAIEGGLPLSAGGTYDRGSVSGMETR
jgi:hypothetical protein